MTIIFSTKVTPSTEARVKKAAGFIALITKAFIEQSKQKYAECKLAEELNKPMYAVVEKGIEWTLFKTFGWRKIFYYEDKPPESIAKEIEEDLRWFKQIRNIDA